MSDATSEKGYRYMVKWWLTFSKENTCKDGESLLILLYHRSQHFPKAQFDVSKTSGRKSVDSLGDNLSFVGAFPSLL